MSWRLGCFMISRMLGSSLRCSAAMSNCLIAMENGLRSSAVAAGVLISAVGFMGCRSLQTAASAARSARHRARACSLPSFFVPGRAGIASRQVVGEALELNFQVHRYHLAVLRHLHAHRHEIQQRAYPRSINRIEGLLTRLGRNGKDGDVDVVSLHQPLEVSRWIDRLAGPREGLHTLLRGIHERHDPEAPGVEALITGQGHPEVAGPYDEHVVLLVETQDLDEMTLQLGDVVAHPAHSELTEVREIFPDLRRVEVELVGQLARGDGLDARLLEKAQAAQVEGQAVRCQPGDLDSLHRAGGLPFSGGGATSRLCLDSQEAAFYHTPFHQAAPAPLLRLFRRSRCAGALWRCGGPGPRMIPPPAAAGAGG